MTYDSIDAMAAAYCGAWNAGNAIDIADFFTKDGRITVNQGSTLVGRSAIRGMALSFLEAFPDLQFRIEGVHSNGFLTVFSWSWDGTYAATDKKCHLSGWDEWNLTRDNQIMTSVSNFDAAAFASQIGRTL